MRRPRFEARRALRLLAVALMLISVGSATSQLSSPAGAAAKGKIVLAWHAGFASRWLDPQEHDGTATPDNFFTAIHDALIKNQGTQLYDHPALAERFTVAADSKSATFTLRKGIRFHNGEPVTPPGVKVEMEAFDGYYRPVHVKELVMVSVPEAATRVAMLERGEADIIYNVPGELINKVGKLPGVTLAPVLSGSFFLEFPNFQDPKNPFRDKRVREAVSLAVDRRAMNQAETGGMGKPTGNWINDDVLYGIEWPEVPRNVEKAKQLLREAGYPNGFDVDWVTPLPTFYSRGERLISQLREVGIRGRLQTMERGIFFQRLQGGLKEFPGTQIILHGVRIAGSWSFWYEAYFKCGGFSSRDRICVKDLDARFEQYERSINPAERTKLAEAIQRGILENDYVVPVFRHAAVAAIGPRIAAQKWQDIFPTITTAYAYPWEDIKLKEH